MIIPFSLAISFNVFILSIVVCVVNFRDKTNLHNGFTIVYGIVGVVSICFIMIEIYRNKRDKVLKNTGTAYDVTDIEVYRGFFGKVRGFNVFYIRGNYIDDDGSIKTVESKKYITLKEMNEMFLNTGRNISKERLSAKVYKNVNNKNSYYVEVLLKQ